MSGLVAILQRRGAPVEPEDMGRLMTRLSHRAIDGGNTYFAENVALGHQHFWTTPEEQGEQQPLQMPGLPFTIIFDGRIDNRTDLFNALGILSSESVHISDTMLALIAYDRWGEECFARLIGSFAVIIYNAQERELLCARDALGDHTLYYWLDEHIVVIASEPWAVLGYPGLETIPDEVSLAHYFAFRAIPEDQSLFKGVRELSPARCMTIGMDKERTFRYWQLNLAAKIRYSSDQDYAQHYLELLTESVRCRLRSITPVGIFMSGGLDSTSVAALAATMLAPEPLTTFSYVFDELKDCDERIYIEEITRRYATRAIYIPGDDAWPVYQGEPWPDNPNYPISSPGYSVNQLGTQRALQEGIHVILNGQFGDHLYVGAEDWLADLVEDGRGAEAVGQVIDLTKKYGLRTMLSSKSIRRLVRRSLDCLAEGKKIPRRKATWQADWLTPFANQQLTTQNDLWQDLEDSGNIRRLAQAESLLGRRTTRLCSAGTYSASRNQIDVRHPYRDRRLITFMLGVPAHQLYGQGVYKLILRNAMRGILPESIRNRTQPTGHVSLLRKGVQIEQARFNQCFTNGNSNWQRYIKPETLSSIWLSLSSGISPNEIRSLVPWLCIGYEQWYSTLYESRLK